MTSLNVLSELNTIRNQTVECKDDLPNDSEISNLIYDLCTDLFSLDRLFTLLFVIRTVVIVYVKLSFFLLSALHGCKCFMLFHKSYKSLLI